MHTGREGFSALPFYDNFDLSQVDILLISQYVKRSFLPQHLLSLACKRYSEEREVCGVEQVFVRSIPRDARGPTMMKHRLQLEYISKYKVVLTSVLQSRLPSCLVTRDYALYTHGPCTDRPPASI